VVSFLAAEIVFDVEEGAQTLRRGGAHGIGRGRDRPAPFFTPTAARKPPDWGKRGESLRRAACANVTSEPHRGRPGPAVTVLNQNSNLVRPCRRARPNAPLLPSTVTPATLSALSIVSSPSSTRSSVAVVRVNVASASRFVCQSRDTARERQPRASLGNERELLAGGLLGSRPRASSSNEARGGVAARVVAACGGARNAASRRAHDASIPEESHREAHSAIGGVLRQRRATSDRLAPPPRRRCVRLNPDALRRRRGQGNDGRSEGCRTQLDDKPRPPPAPACGTGTSTKARPITRMAITGCSVSSPRSVAPM